MTCFLVAVDKAGAKARRFPTPLIYSASVLPITSKGVTMNSSLAIRLTWAGLLPFVIGAVLLLLPSLARWLGVDLAVVSPLFVFYAMAIALFMAGTHWGVGLASQTPQTMRWPLIVSNGQLLILWPVFALCDESTQLGMVAVSLLISLGVDRYYRRVGLLSPRYYRHRFVVTGGVVGVIVGVLLG